MYHITVTNKVMDIVFIKSPIVQKTPSLQQPSNIGVQTLVVSDYLNDRFNKNYTVSIPLSNV